MTTEQYYSPKDIYPSVVPACPKITGNITVCDKEDAVTLVIYVKSFELVTFWFKKRFSSSIYSALFCFTFLFLFFLGKSLLELGGNNAIIGK